MELLRSDVEVRGLAHITSGGLGNLNRLAADVGYEIDDPLPVPPVFELIQERASVPDEQMHEVFNMAAASALSSRRTTRAPRSSCCAGIIPAQGGSAGQLPRS